MTCFLIFVAAKVDNNETRELMAYSQIFLLLAHKHGGLGWTIYVNQFSQMAAAGTWVSWTEINSFLIAAPVLGAGGDSSGWVCPRCLAVDHGARQCTLVSLDANKNPPWTPPPSGWPTPRFRPYHPQEEICCSFNWGTCLAAPCKFKYSMCAYPATSWAMAATNATKGAQGLPTRASHRFQVQSPVRSA